MLLNQSNDQYPLGILKKEISEGVALDRPHSAAFEQQVKRKSIVLNRLGEVIEHATIALNSELHMLASDPGEKLSLRMLVRNALIGMVPFLGAIKDYADAQVEFENGLQEKSLGMIEKAREDYLIAVFNLGMDFESAGLIGRIPAQIVELANALKTAHQAVVNLPPREPGERDTLETMASHLLQIPGIRHFVDTMLTFTEPERYRSMAHKFEAYEDHGQSELFNTATY